MKALLTTCFLLSCVFSFSQEKETFYVFNADWKPTVMDSAKYVLIIREKEDNNWEWDYYGLWGPLPFRF